MNRRRHFIKQQQLRLKQVWHQFAIAYMIQNRNRFVAFKDVKHLLKSASSSIDLKPKRTSFEGK